MPHPTKHDLVERALNTPFHEKGREKILEYFLISIYDEETGQAVASRSLITESIGWTPSTTRNALMDFEHNKNWNVVAPVVGVKLTFTPKVPKRKK